VQRFSNIKRASTEAVVRIFLSHSHKDRDLVQGLIVYFEGLGISIYVDWNDSSMPRITNRETAEKIKKEIGANDLLMVLATRNAVDSKWIPWEVGVADQMKGEARVLVIPVADPSGKYEGAEYLQLYRRILTAQGGGKGIFAPDAASGAMLDVYLKLFGKI